MTRLHTASSGLAVLALAGTAAGQLALPHTFVGEQVDDLFGRAIARIADVDGDGTRDLLVGAPWHDLPGAQDAGVARVFSGRDGAVLRTHPGLNANASHGHAIADAGDVDADGVPDYAVCAPGDTTAGAGAGAVYVYSGATGNVLHVLLGPAPGAGFGNAVAGAGDVDGDGREDVLVGAVFEGAGGSVRVHSGLDGSVLFAFLGSSVERVGRGLAGAGDVDQDGRADFLVAVHNARRIDLHSGATGLVLRSFLGGSAASSALFGSHLDLVADLDGDGVDDVVASDFGTGFGAVWVYSARTGAVIWTAFGSSAAPLVGAVSRAGDIDGDGEEDVLVGVSSDSAAGPSAGRVDVWSGRTGTLVASFPGAPEERFGSAVAPAGDVDGDGTPDLFVGATRTSGAGLAPGIARLCSGRSFDGIGTRYCAPALPNSTGTPAVVQVFGSRAIPANDVVLVASALPPGATGYFLTSAARGFSSPPGSVGFLCLGGSIGRYVGPGQVVQGPVGRLAVDLTAMPVSPAVAVAPGETWRFQCWYRDAAPGGGVTSNLSDAVEVAFE